jgi:hypothetical protein
MALGLKGGFALSQSGLNVDVAKGLGAAVFLAIFIPTIGYQLLKRITGPFDAAAIAATYGSVRAVPAALKLAIPEASPSLYLGLSLGLTFPLNIILGIPLYSYLANWAI